MQIKLANPLYYPITVLAGGITLIIGVRVVQLPSIVMLPTAAIIATTGASWLKSRSQESRNLDNLELERELKAVQDSARHLATIAKALRLEATKLITNSEQLELLATVQYACEQADVMPKKIDQLAQKLHSSDSLLSVNDLQQQLATVNTRLQSSSGIAKTHLEQLAISLQRNIHLAQQGQDSRIVQVISLSTLIQDSLGVLQQLQNQLRDADLTNSTQILELRSLSQQFNSYQENVNLLVNN